MRERFPSISDFDNTRSDQREHPPEDWSDATPVGSVYEIQHSTHGRSRYRPIALQQLSRGKELLSPYGSGEWTFGAAPDRYAVTKIETTVTMIDGEVASVGEHYQVSTGEQIIDETHYDVTKGVWSGDWTPKPGVQTEHWNSETGQGAVVVKEVDFVDKPATLPDAYAGLLEMYGPLQPWQFNAADKLHNADFSTIETAVLTAVERNARDKAGRFLDQYGQDMTAEERVDIINRVAAAALEEYADKAATLDIQIREQMNKLHGIGARGRFNVIGADFLDGKDELNPFKIAAQINERERSPYMKTPLNMNRKQRRAEQSKRRVAANKTHVHKRGVPDRQS